jgi:DivIVA domain-containing protein
VELDRRQIEKHDFATARRGYDPAEVDRHLGTIAEAVEALKAKAGQPTVAGVAAERVEAIVAAAEASAREIEERARVDAAERASRAQEVADRLAARAEEIQQQMTEVMERIAGLKDAIAAMSAELGRPAPIPEPAPEPVPLQAVPDPEPQPEPRPEPRPEPVPEPQPRAAEGARLIALNMALSGKSREETARYLRENYELEDAERILDDVYAKAGG